MTASSILTRPRLFAQKRKNGSYLFDREKLIDTFDSETDLCIPLNIDTEFQSQGDVELGQSSRIGITTQVSGIVSGSTQAIFEHPGLGYGFYPTCTTGFDAVDYLQALGHDCKLERVQNVPQGLPNLEFVLYAHFALAEALMVVRGAYRDDFLELMRETSTKKAKFEMTRRLCISSPRGNGFSSDATVLPWLLTLDGVTFHVSICFVDIGAIHGVASYAQVCEATGVKLDSKELLKTSDKEQMLTTYVTKRTEFDAYAKGDLFVYDALEGNAKHFKAIYGELGLEDYYVEPKLTIGSTVKNLFLAALKNHLAIEANNKEAGQELEQTFLKPASAAELRLDPTSTKALLAKVEGGRARNNRSIETLVEKPLVDLDIDGCYGEGQRNQMYFIGSPRIVEFKAKPGANKYWTLGQFLKDCKNVLVPGAWFARVSTTPSHLLKFSQDFLASWFVNGQAGEDLLAKYVSTMSSDTERVGVDESFDEESGELKIFNREVLNGTISADFVDWLENICSKQQRAELKEHLHVKAAAYYDANDRVDSYEELKSNYANWSDKSTVKRLKSGVLQSEDRGCHSWMGIPMNELIIDRLIANRKRHPKKTPMNSLYKLIINTLYGDMTSKFFMSANVVVGNNITARARALAYYMEKGLNGFQTITDGCAFELNSVVFPKKGRTVTAESVVNLFRDRPTDRQLALKPLGGWDDIALTFVELNKVRYPSLLLTKGESFVELKPFSTVSGDVQVPAMRWVNDAAMLHLQKLFPVVSVLHQQTTQLYVKNGERCYKPRTGMFNFEAKGCYSKGKFHGAANYELSSPVETNLKFRSYETKKRHYSFADELALTSRYDSSNNPAKDFMKQMDCPSAIARQEPFVKSAILKPNDYRNRLVHYESVKLSPGDSFWKPGLFREFSLSQFAFQELAQFKAWQKAVEGLKNKNGQSFEMFFVNEDSTLDFARMLRTLDAYIASGCKTPTEMLSKGHRKVPVKHHPHAKCYEALKAKMAQPGD